MSPRRRTISAKRDHRAVRLIMADNFQAFIDDSRSRDEFVLAGHIATPGAWAAFSQKWNDILPLATKAKNGKWHFKMSEMAMRPALMSHVPTFYKLIEDHVICSISCRMNMEVYASAIAKAEKATFGLQVSNHSYQITVDPGIWRNPYRLLFRLMMDTFHMNRKTFVEVFPLEQKVDFIFDDQSEKEAIISDWAKYVELREGELKPFFGAIPRFENDQEFLPLQAADLWAWWVREWYEEDSSEFPDRLRKFDFGQWRGRERTVIAISAEEHQILDFVNAASIERSIEVDEWLRDNS
jgi:hypothetical protein